MGYHVDIAIFTDLSTDNTGTVDNPTDLSWSIDETEGDRIPDDLEVLAGLSFGWSTPANGLWPLQPNPMFCSLGINIPDFSEITVNEGDALSVEVKADSAGPVIARFYGNVTDWKASNRPGRPGVTLSLAAVDPMAGLNELLGLPLPSWVVLPIREESVVSELWANFGEPADVSDLWTSPQRNVWPDYFITGEPVNALSVVNGILLQAVNMIDRTRMIMSPNIGANGAVAMDPTSSRRYTLDTIGADPGRIGADPGDSFEPPADAVRADAITWSAALGQNPGIICAAGYGGDAANRVLAGIDVVPSRGLKSTQTIQVTCNTEVEAQDTADFYAASGFAQWQIEGATVEVTKRDVDVPVGLFPNWKAAEGDPARGACYNRRIVISGIDPTRTPDGTGVIDGILVGATCRIAGRALALDLAVLRRMTSEVGDLFILGGYALAPIGELARV